MQRSRNGQGHADAGVAASGGRAEEPAPRARQRAFCIAALAHGDDLSELEELLSTAGVAVVGEMVQQREQPHPNTYLGPGKVDRGEGRREGGRRQRDRLRRRADRPPGAQPGGGDRASGGRPHDRDPRHLRLAREQRRGQAAGRARAARVQPRADARPVDAPRATRRRHRHARPRRDADRDRPPAGARPDRGAAPAPGARQGHARGAARRARARGAADDRAGRLHERRQVDAAQRADRLGSRRARPTVPHARPDHAHAEARAAARIC